MVKAKVSRVTEDLCLESLLFSIEKVKFAPFFNILFVLPDDMGKMELDNKRNKQTMLNEHGQYPVWMNQRQAKKLKGKRMASKGKQQKKKHVAW